MVVLFLPEVTLRVSLPLKLTLLLSFSESLVGNLVITQNSSVSWPNSYITKKTLKISFLLHDPSDFFKSASFFYRWDFGDGYASPPPFPPLSLSASLSPRSHYRTLTALEFIIQTRMVSNAQRCACFCPSRIEGVGHHDQLFTLLKIKSRQVVVCTLDPALSI